jgi:hypothetical protein
MAVNAKVNTTVPERAEDLIVFALVLVILFVGIVWVINALSGALGSVAGDAEGLGTTVLNAPGTLLKGVFGKGAALGWLNPGNWFGTVSNEGDQ